MTQPRTETDSSRPEEKGTFCQRMHNALPPLSAHLLFWPLAAAGIALDLWSKKAVFDWLEYQRSFSIIDGFLQFVLIENAGAAFGIAQGQRGLLTAVSVIALIIVVLVFLFSGERQKLAHVAFAFFAAGICGNLYDRIFNAGLVRDFIDVRYWPGRHWPAFNVADSLLCIAVGLMILSAFLTPQQSPRKHARQHK